MSAAVEKTLREGAKLHGFLSGGGLRVLRVERDGDLLGYGEHPHVDEALRILSDDLAAGGRDYADVYGKIETHYLTGASTPHDGLDAWLRRGQTCDAFADGDDIVFKLAGYEHHEMPAGVCELLFAGAVRSVTYTSERGVTYEATRTRFPNGEPAIATQCIAGGKGGSDPWMWHATKTGRGATLQAAITAAFAAPSVET